MSVIKDDSSQWLPSDADMLDWVERKQAMLTPHQRPYWRVYWMEGTPHQPVGILEETGSSLRATIEHAMRRSP